MIEFNPIHDIYKLPAPEKNRTVRKTAEPTAKPASSEYEYDQIQISPEAALKVRLDAVYKINQQKEPTVSPARMAQLIQAYRGDRCPVSSREIAGAILERIAGHTPEFNADRT